MGAENTDRKTALNHLLTAYREVKNTPFPHPITQDVDIWDLHGYVAEWDALIAGWMNGIIEKIAAGKQPLLSVRIRVPSFEKMIQRLLRDKPEHAEILLAYRRHYQNWIGFSEQVERFRKEWRQLRKEK